MNGIKTGLGMTPGEHIISADSALSRNIRLNRPGNPGD